MFAACLAQNVLGLDGPASLSWVRRYIQGAVETKAQEAFVLNF
jgi:hypothetical protein